MTSPKLLVLRVDGDHAVGAERHDDGRTQSVDRLPAGAVDAWVHLTTRFPKHLLAWRDRCAEATLSPVEGWGALVRHDLEIRHGAFLHRRDPVRASLGAADFLSPFLIPAPRDRPFGTWLLSPLCGIAATDTLRRAGAPPAGLSFAAALLVLGHRALQGGALLWSDPGLAERGDPLRPDGLSDRDAALTVRHTAGRRFLPLWLGARIAERHFPLGAVIAAGLARSDSYAPPTPPKPPARPNQPVDVEVAIATLGRRAMLADVLTDLGRQTLPPVRVVVVEQVPVGDPDPGPLDVGRQPYDLVYRRLTLPGACNARNVALAECRSHWVLLADDDLRFGPGYVRAMVEVAHHLHADAVVAGVGAAGADGMPTQEVRLEHDAWPRMWPFFGTGLALAARALFDEVGGFDRRLEGGYGEDYEWGVRARLGGAMVVHAPGIKVAHHSAPTGGLRAPFPHPWRGQAVSPVPSPTVVLSHQLWETPAMRRGWAGLYWGRRLLGTWPAGPIAMWRRWRAAHDWADWLEHSQEPERATAIGP